jgi:hypothetical protein
MSDLDKARALLDEAKAAIEDYTPTYRDLGWAQAATAVAHGYIALRAAQPVNTLVFTPVSAGDTPPG